jgi:hypothetical protein
VNELSGSDVPAFQAAILSTLSDQNGTKTGDVADAQHGAKVRRLIAL